MKVIRTSEDVILNIDNIVSIEIVKVEAGVNFKDGYKIIASYSGIGENSRPFQRVLAEFPDYDSAYNSFGLLIADINYDSNTNVVDFGTLVYKALTTDYIEARGENTAHITGVAVDKNDVIITLDCKVDELNTTDGGGEWGEHKWIGIGLKLVGANSAKWHIYNGVALTDDDIEEATLCGLDSPFFIRWVAADLALVDNNTKKSKNYFRLAGINGNTAERTYNLKIVES